MKTGAEKKWRRGLGIPLAAALLVLLPAGMTAQTPGMAERGRDLYLQACATCHGPTGAGLPDLGVPPLAGSDFLAADLDRAIRISQKGIMGPITVNGRAYQGLMPAQVLIPFTAVESLDQQIADVLTYVNTSWGNDFITVLREDVTRVRAKDAAYLIQPLRASADARRGATPMPEVVTPLGQELYRNNCANCHQEDGGGVPGAIPPLAGSDFLAEDHDRTIRILLNGMIGPIIVNNRPYDTVMPVQVLSDVQITEALNYVFNTWGNGFGFVTESDVARVRSEK